MSLTVVWELIKLFAPIVLVLLLIAISPLPRWHRQYLAWLDRKFSALNEKQVQKAGKHYIQHQFKILDVWYNAWFDDGRTEPCPMSWLRNASSLKVLHHRIDEPSDSIVFYYRDYDGDERRWPLKTVDLEK